MTTKQILLSIIVPVYNREATLSDLMQSLLAIESDAVEIILVNDGSTDASLALCNSFAEKDARVKVIDKENGGVSSARNAGIDAASGTYLAFADGDDLIVPEVFEGAIRDLTDPKADLLIFDYLYHDIRSGEERKSYFVLPSDHVMNKDEIVAQILSLLLLHEGTGLASVWHKLFSASLVKEHGIRFCETLHYGEDWRFVVDFLDVAQSALYRPEVLYIYRLDGSQTESKYRQIYGTYALPPYRCKFDLCEKYKIEIPLKRRCYLYRSLLQTIAASSCNCTKEEFSAMLGDPFVRDAARFLLSLDRDDRLTHEITKRYRLYARLILLRAHLLLRLLAKYLLP